MKLSLNWIKDYVKLPDDMDLSRLAYDLTMSTVEVEGASDSAVATESGFFAKLASFFRNIFASIFSIFKK